MKKIIISCLLIFLCEYPQAQTAVRSFNKFDFYNGKIPDTENKFVILDFFATWCTPCIGALPHLDSLQKTFGKDLQVIAVTKEDRKTLSEFFKNNPRLRALNISFITGDSVLHKNFPYLQIPHEVILDRNGKMLAATYPKALTHESIRQLVTGKANVSFPRKQDRKYEHNLSLTNQIIPTQMITSQVLITDYMPGAPSISGIKEDSTYTRYYFINMPLISLLQVVHHRPYTAPFKLIGSFDLKTLICYEITVPKEKTIKQVHEMMLSDLQSRYGLTTAVVPSENSPATVLQISVQNMINETHKTN